MKTYFSLPSDWQLLNPVTKKYLPAHVPGCVHTDLLRNGAIPDPFWGSNELGLQWIEEKDWHYRCEFTPSKEIFSHQHIELVAEGLDTLATIYLNGHEIGNSNNMFIAYRFDISKWLLRGINTLEVHFTSSKSYIHKKIKPDHYQEWNDAVGGSSLIRKEQCQSGWDWGPRFVTSGIWLPIRIEGWSGNRIESVKITQKHSANSVELFAELELANSSKVTVAGAVSFEGEIVAEFKNGKTKITNPKLWWPNGHGKQPLYEVEILILDVSGKILDTWKKKIGLRTLKLDRHKDKYGESFQFVVNGRAIFAKGANWIPAHSFVTEGDHNLYDNLLSSAVEAHMNMIRVWGGGIYEKEEFYDLCDKKGLLVWQDFMFACALYPGDKEFLNSVRDEAEYQVKRLRNRTCLALWCGNNEIEYAREFICKTKKTRKAYEDIFYKILPQAVKDQDGVTAYWESSPHNPKMKLEGEPNNDDSGDSHFWDVWHARKPVKRYEEMQFRFCSEFGMQSYSSPEVASTFCKPENFNVFSATMENHQKNNAGNLIIFEYISRLYRFPKNYDALAYLSQLNQAYCMKVGIEHFRRSMPRTMGALYWQLNDCWPVFSWSSIEFGGKWKALQFAAKRFFSPMLVSAHVPGDEIAGKGNLLKSTIHDVALYTVSDLADDTKAKLSWTLYHLDGRKLSYGQMNVVLHYGESKKQKALDFAKEIKQYEARNIYLRIRLEAQGQPVSEGTVFLTAPRYMDLARKSIETDVRQISDHEFELIFESSDFHHQAQFELSKISHKAEDNFFDLYPGEKRTVRINTKKASSIAQIKKVLSVRSLADTYE